MAEVAVVSQGDAEHAECAPNAKVECRIGKVEDMVPQSTNDDKKGDCARRINPELIPGDSFSHSCHGSGWIDAVFSFFDLTCFFLHI